MVAAAHFKVDYAVTTKNTRVKTVGPIQTFAGPPPDAFQPAAVGFAGQLNGINQMVCTYLPSYHHVLRLWLTPIIDSWGGALLFVAFLAEMRHPMDFWKGLLCAQIFICVVYIFFGVFVSHSPFVMLSS